MAVDVGLLRAETRARKVLPRAISGIELMIWWRVEYQAM